MADFLPMDVIVEILLRLPTSSRRRFRLVCRPWHHAVDTHTTEMQSRPKTLVATGFAALYLLKDPTPSSSDGNIERWTGDAYDGKSLVGTYNGFVCMCDSQKPGMPITLVNPVTGERLAIPPLPLPPHTKSYSALTCSFAYHPMTGRYKAVHVPYSFDRVWVFTLGEALWRDVSIGSPMEIFDLYNGIVSIDGAVKGPEAKIMSFDLDTETIASIRPLPKAPSSSFQLIEVQGRLGVTISHDSLRLDKLEVWVMEHAMPGQRTWSHRYSLWMEKPGRTPSQVILHQHELTLPNFTTHHNKYVMTMKWCLGLHGYVFYKHKSSTDVRKGRHGVVEISKSNPGEIVPIIPTNYVRRPRTFTYVETKEPLSVYRCW